MSLCGNKGQGLRANQGAAAAALPSGLSPVGNAPSNLWLLNETVDPMTAVAVLTSDCQHTHQHFAQQHHVIHLNSGQAHAMQHRALVGMYRVHLQV